MINFAEGWEPDRPITQEMATEMLKKFFKQQYVLQSEAPASVHASHIAQYIEYMMYTKNHKILDLTITKDDDGNLVFDVVHKE